VPEVAGLSVVDASSALQQATLTSGPTREEWDETVPAGQVIGADPPTGRPLRPGAAVTLLVSKGREPINLVDWSGKDAQQAKVELTGRGLTVIISGEEFSATTPKGSVIAQTPKPGTLRRGDTVTFVVSKGPEMVLVPKVSGQTENDARRALQAAGFEVRVQRLLGGLFGTAHSTSPGAGRQAPRGSTVTLRVV
jgi:serine/threonine-protein kinase